MSRRLAPASLPEFTSWLTIRRPLGLALTSTQFAIGDASGSAWVMDWTSKLEHLCTILDAVQASGRKAWAARAADVSIIMARRLGIDVTELSWLLDATTAHNVVRPGDEFEPWNQGAARDAVATARLIFELQQDTPKATRAAVLFSCEQELLWRSRQLRGWHVDMDLLAAETAGSNTSREASMNETGTDLVTTATGADKARIHTWLAKSGITIVDKDGRATLARDDLDDGSTVPNTEEARLAWAQFRRARSVASRLGKLREIRNAVRHDRVFSNLLVRGTRTGRMTSRTPALQNLHRDLRPLLVADNGESLVALDLGQVEPRVMAGLSGDPVLAAALRAGDVYADLARRIWRNAAVDAEGNVLKERRDAAKTLLLAIFYGKGKGALARNLGVNQETAGVLLKQTLGQYPALTGYTERLKQQMRQGRAGLTADGRPVPPPQKGEYAVLNNRVQAEAADLFYVAVTRVAKRVGADRLWLGIHDELVLSVPSNLTEAAKVVLEEEMASVFHGIPVGGRASDLGRAWRKPDE